MNNRGFTLVEWLVAMLIGLFLLAGIFSIFVASRATTQDAFDQGELQENGRLAMRLISHDLKWAGFFGEYTGLPLQVGPSLSLSAGSTVTASDDCLDERSIGSLPSNAAETRAIWVSHISSTKTMNGFGCIQPDARVADTDVISIKRLLGRPIPATEALDINRFYMATNAHEARLISGSETRPVFGVSNESQLWEYQHYIYYVSMDGTVPVLKKRYLTVNSGSLLIGGDIADGIERLVMLYGVDDTAIPDGVVDRYIPINQMIDSYWGEGRITGVRLFILVRSINPSTGYKNNNTYQLGPNVTVKGNGDGYRRLLLESSIALRNPMVVLRGGT